MGVIIFLQQREIIQILFYFIWVQNFRTVFKSLNFYVVLFPLLKLRQKGLRYWMEVEKFVKSARDSQQQLVVAVFPVLFKF